MNLQLQDSAEVLITFHSSYRFYVPVAYFEFSKKQNLTTKMSIDEIYQKLGLKAVQTGRSTR